jgi:putative transposase
MGVFYRRHRAPAGAIRIEGSCSFTRHGKLARIRRDSGCGGAAQGSGWLAGLAQYEGGEKTTDICRKLGVSQATFYVWKKQYAGLGVQELHELRSLREENGRLKRIVADLTLDRQILQEIVSKKL